MRSFFLITIYMIEIDANRHSLFDIITSLGVQLLCRIGYANNSWLYSFSGITIELQVVCYVIYARARIADDYVINNE